MKYLYTSNYIEPEAIIFLENNEIGQEGSGMVYQHVNVKPKIEHIASNTEYLQMKLGGKMVGICANIQRTFLNEQTTGYYIRYFSFLKNLRVKEVNLKRADKNSIIKQEVSKYFSRLEGSTIYAYVDLTNARSRVLCDIFNFNEVGQFATLIFSRISPKVSKRIGEVDIGEVKELLSSQYKDYSLFTIDNLRYRYSKYYVIKREEDGEVLAGLSLTKEQWRILSIPSFLGQLLMKTKIPFLDRLFNSKYRFLAVEGIYMKEGCEKELTELLEGILHKTGFNVAMMWADVNSPLYKMLKSLPLGVLSKFKSEVRASVIARNHEMAMNNIYISGFDLT